MTRLLSAGRVPVLSATNTQIIATVRDNTGRGSVRRYYPQDTATLSRFTYSIPKPTISSFTPASGSTGTSVVITGTNLTGATAVIVGGTGHQSFNVNSSTQITAIIGAGASE